MSELGTFGSVRGCPATGIPTVILGREQPSAALQGERQLPGGQSGQADDGFGLGTAVRCHPARTSSIGRPIWRGRCRFWVDLCRTRLVGTVG